MPLDTPEAMLDILFNEIVNDVVFSLEKAEQEHDRLALIARAEEECRRRISAILETMDDEDKISYLNYMNGYMVAYQENGRRSDGE